MKIFATVLLGGFGLLWFGAVAALDAKLLSELARQFDSRTFPNVTGQVTHSEVTTRRGSKGGVMYGVKIRYQYTVNDNLYAADRYRYNAGMSSSGSRWAHAMVASHPVGSPINVFYNPANPQEALLSAGIDGEDLLALLFMTPFNLIALAIVWFPLAAARQNYFPKPAGGARIFMDPPRVRVQLPSYSPWIALPVVFGLCFVGMIVVSLVSEGHPSMRLMTSVWGVVLGIGAAVFAWRWSRIRSGVEDLVIDESNGSINLPMTCGRKDPVTVNSCDIETVSVKRILRQRSRGRNSYWFCPVMKLQQEAKELRLAQWTSEARAEAFAKWLGERLRL